jgi:gamma-glutamyltranspeptidase/glutathione hydrolase
MVRVRPALPDPAVQFAEARRAMVTTSHPVATEAGLNALRRGGTAVDAYLAAAATQTVVEPTMTSLAGGLGITLFDPASATSRVVGGLGKLPAAEDGDLDEESRWSGRTVVVPGWVCAARAAWEKWGALPWRDLFTDAIACAREGFVVDQLLWGTMWEARRVAGMYEAGREVWFPRGRLVCVGDELRQPALARTLEQLAEDGPAFFYEGDFARDLVATVRAAGGRLTHEDMAAGREAVLDVELPATPLASGHELHGTGFLYATALNLATIGGLPERARPTDDPETLYLLLRLFQEAWHHNLALAEGSPPVEEIVAGVSPERVQDLWSLVESGPPRPFDPMNLDTNGIVVVDDAGRIAYGTHSTSSTPFGVGLMVDGVVLARPLYYFANPIVQMPLGWATSLLLLRGGRPVFAAASPSSSAVENLLQNTLNVLAWGLTPAASVQQPRFGAPMYPGRSPMIEATIGDELVEAVERRGLALRRVSPWEQEMGSCHAVQLLEDGTLLGVADPRRLGRAAGL